MKIRALTLGTNTEYIEEEYDEFEELLHSFHDLKQDFQDINIDVETIRMCTPPFHKDTHLNQSMFYSNPTIVLDALDDFCDDGLLDFYSAHAGLCDQVEDLTKTQIKLINRIPSLLSEHENMFTSLQVSSLHGINFEAIQHASELTKEIAKIDGFLNLKFAATFNVKPNTPFFPSAYHLGKNLKLTIALEAADEIINISKKYCNEDCGMHEIHTHIQERFTKIYDDISTIAKPFSEKHHIQFVGVDFSPAQYPVPDKSIAKAIESFELSKFGEIGTVFGIGFLTSALKSIDRPQIGFSGFMQPLLEDYFIAKRHEEGLVNITQLLLNSCVCGLGLDCIPLPGDINVETLALLMMDVAMISSRLNKPLTTRLMPIEGKKSGEMTEFNFEYFKNSTICDIAKNSNFKLNEFVKKNRNIQI
ncbi:MAG: DUF711 family protein [Candidatus Lokiarchaeota archaeon]|nr:DUF711 family protein [Candidatus Lokiarchaeota archaeon]